MDNSNTLNKKIFIFGNGIGIALEGENNVKKDTFSLKNAFDNCWENVEDGIQELIENLIGHCGCPDNEEDLRHLQRYCWSSSDDKENAITKYLANVTYQFFNINSNLFEKTKLCESLCDLIRNQKKGAISVATLNYDQLLYGSLCSRGIFKEPYLIDGFLNGFSPIKCAKQHPDSGWLLHLHGSPLYITENDQVRKRSIADTENQASAKENVSDDSIIDEFQNTFKKHHIVLTAPFYKYKIIEDSIVLNSYWDSFKSLLSDQKNNPYTMDVIFIGYSGNDPHLNSLIRENEDTINSITVIEHNFPKEKWYSKKSWYDKELRKIFWKTKLSNTIKLIPSENINSLDLNDILKIQ